MAQISSNNIITINRGDTFIYSFYITLGSSIDSEIYTLQEGDRLYLGVCAPNQPFECAIIKKVFNPSNMESDGTIEIVFEAIDTLHLLPGNYYYSIKLSQYINETEEKITTIIPRTKFVIIE